MIRDNQKCNEKYCAPEYSLDLDSNGVILLCWDDDQDELVEVAKFDGEAVTLAVGEVSAQGLIAFARAIEEWQKDHE